MGFHRECNFSLQDARSNIGRIVDAVTKREPLSFVRIGDGEGHLLSICETSTLEDIYYLSSHFGANRVTFRDLVRLRYELRRACENADIVGLREDVLNVSVEPAWFSLPPSAQEQKVKKQFRLRPVEMALNPFGCRRLAFTNQTLSRSP